MIRVPAEEAGIRGSKPGSCKIIFFSGNSTHAMEFVQPPAFYVQRAVYVAGAED